jgi:Trk K+ transport system NAD-binding subunit
VLLIADVPVAAGAELAGQLVEEVHQTGEVRVLALRKRGSESLDWSPPHDHQMVPQDRLFVLATREGLSRVLTRSRPR